MSARILVVDDEPQIRRVMKHTLAAQSYLVTEARSGEQALEKLRVQKQDLVLLDVNMPGMGGLETCRAIRSDSDVAVIMLTVRNTDKDKVEALDAGADDVSSDSDTFQVLTSPDKLHAVRDALEKAGLAIAHSEVTRIPENTVAVSGHAAEQVLKLMEELEDHDDVQGVAANFDISDEEMAQFSAA